MKKEKLTSSEAMRKAGEIIDGAGGVLFLFFIFFAIDIFLSITFNFDQLGDLFTKKGILIAVSSWKGILLLILTYFSAFLLLVWIILLAYSEIIISRVENGKYDSY